MYWEESRKKLITLMKYYFTKKLSDEIVFTKVKQIQENMQNKYEFIYINEYNEIILDIDEVFSFLLPFEVFNVQSSYTRDFIDLYYDSYYINKKYWDTLPEPAQTVNELQENYKNMSKDKNFYKEKLRSIELEHKNIKRDSFEYNKILDYKDFELNNNFAYEFAKRKFPKLYINEYLYCKRLAKSYLSYVGPIGIINHLNEVKTTAHRDNQVDSYNKIILELLEGIENNKSFFNFIDRFYRISKIMNDGEDYDFERSDLIINNHYDHKNYNDSLTKVMYNFRLPRLRNSLHWEANIRINFAWPEEQILDYIKHLKYTLSTREKQITDEEFADDCIPEVGPDVLVNFNKNIRKNIDIRETVGDILFTYDALKINMTKKQIGDKLNEYHYEKFGRYLNSINDIVSAYCKLAIILIEKENYSYLIDP